MKINNQSPPGTSLVDSARSTEKAKGANPKAPANAQKVSSPSGDSQVSISENARLMGTAAEVARTTPDVRADKVESLRKKIQSGTYQVDSGSIAEKLLEEHLNSDFGKNNL